MSEGPDSSHSYSMDQNIQIHANNEGQNQIYIPVWEQEGSSNHTQLTHLLQQIKILKNKCHHLENHIEESHREFSSLNQLYIISQSNERRLLRQNAQLKAKIRDLNNQLLHANTELKNSASMYNEASNREITWREDLRSFKQREEGYLRKIQSLQSQNEDLKRKLMGSSSLGDDERLKKMYEERISKINSEWSTIRTNLEAQLEQQRGNERKAGQQLKKITNIYNSHKQSTEKELRQLETSLEQKKREYDKLKADKVSLEQQLKEVRGVLEEVSNKNDDLETQLSDEINKNNRINKEWQRKYKELQNQLNDKQRQNESNSQRFENLIKGLRGDLQKVKIRKDTELQEAADLAEQRVNILKKNHENERSRLNTKISELEEEVRSQRTKISSLTNQLTLSQGDDTEKEQLLRVRQDLFKARDDVGKLKKDFDKANKRIKELQSPLNSGQESCGHQLELQNKAQQIDHLTSQNKKMTKTIEVNRQAIENQKRKVNELTTKTKQNQQLLQSLDLEKKKHEKDHTSLLERYNQLEKQYNKLKKDLQNAQKRGNDTGKIDMGKQQQLEELLQEKNQRINQLEEQVEALSKRIQQNEGRQSDKDKIKKLEQKVKDKDKRINQLEEELTILHTQLQEVNEKIENLSGELRCKQSQINKKDKKIKNMESELRRIKQAESENDEQLQKLREELETLRSKSKSEKDISEQIKNKSKLIQRLKNQLANFKSMSQNQQQNSDQKQSQFILELKQTIKELKQQIVEKQSIIANLRKQLEKKGDKDEEVSSQSLEKLEQEYKRELLSLKRLIAYKGSKGEADTKKFDQLKIQYETKTEALLNEYNKMQQEMYILREQVLSRQHIVPPLVVRDPGFEIEAMEDIWRCKVQELSSERQILVEKVSLWEKRYEELKCLFEAKLNSKEETINLMHLKINNLQMGRSRNTGNCCCSFQSIIR